MLEPKYYLRVTQGERQAYYSYLNGEKLFCMYSEHVEYDSAEKVQKEYDYLVGRAGQSYDDLPYEIRHFANRNGGPVDIDIIIVEPFKVKGFTFNTHSNK